MQHRGKIALALTVLLALLGGAWLYSVIRENRPHANQVIWGVTFSKKQAEALGLDWKQTYRALLNDLGFRRIRIAADWDNVEPTRAAHEWSYHWSDVDWMLAEAEKVGAKVHFVVGRRTPRWPECHIPDWAKKLKEDDQRLAVLATIKATVEHVKKSPTIVRWQVENEPLLDAFGVCPPGDRGFLIQEIQLVRSLDNRPIATTESGELSTWVRTAPLVDVLGISLYRVTWGKFWGNIYYPLTPAFYRRKAEAVSLLGPSVIITELQAEPWGSKPIQNMTVEEQYASMNPENVRANIEFARRVSMPEVYLWGAEWWYWLKTKQERPEIWNAVKQAVK